MSTKTLPTQGDNMNPKFVRCTKKPRGYTAVEMMVVIAIAGVIFGIAVPPMVDFINSRRVTQFSNDLYGSLRLARSEAIRRNTCVSVLQNEDGDWSQGWRVVYYDNAGTPTCNSALGNETLVRASEAEYPQLKIDSPATTITFNRYGRLDGVIENNDSSACWSKCTPECSATESPPSFLVKAADEDISVMRCVSVRSTGMPQVKRSES